MLDLTGLRVGFIAGTLGQGGAERQLFYILRALQGCGAKTQVLCLAQGEFWEGPIRQLGIPVRSLGHQKWKLSRLARIVRELRRDPVDIVQSQHFYTNLYAVTAARLLGISGVGAIRNAVGNEMRAAGSPVGSLSLRMPRLIAANSAAAIREAVALGVPESRFFLLPNVVDTDQFSGSDRKKRSFIRLVAVGRLVPQKRFDRFLTLLARLRATSHCVVGRIVGSGPLREELTRQAAEQSLSPEDLVMDAAVPNAADVYQDADILVLTSDAEGTPNVVLEAMASGLAVVATRVGGVEEIIRDGETGYVTKPGDEEELFRVLLALVCDRDLRLRIGRAARQEAVDRHSSHRLPGLLSRLYDRSMA